MSRSRGGRAAVAATAAARSSSSQRYASAVAHAKRRFDHESPGATRHRPDRSRRRVPAPSAVPPARKNVTSDPSCAAMRNNSRRGCRVSQRRLSPASAAAASALPPPSPAAAGIDLSRRTCTSRGSPGRPAAFHSRSAARQTRFVRSPTARPAHARVEHERTAPSRSCAACRTSRSSGAAVRTSWNHPPGARAENAQRRD